MEKDKLHPVMLSLNFHKIISHKSCYVKGVSRWMLAILFIGILGSNAQITEASEILLSHEELFNECHVEGSTTLYDPGLDQWFTTDIEDTEKRTLPASTFKIFHSLIALDRGVTSPSEVFVWDGTQRAIPVWNQDTRFEDAFKNSTVWVYEEVAHRISLETYRIYLRWAEYEGNQDIEHGKNKNFWVYGNFGVSPKEQIQMLVKLYKEELPFSHSAMESVKNFMCEGDTCSKTGWTQKDGEHIGWWIGYRMFDQEPLFFATRIVKDVNQEIGHFADCRKSITENIIEQYDAKKGVN